MDSERGQTIVFVSHAAGLCGAERSLLDLVRGMGKAPFRTLVIVPGEGPLSEALSNEGIAWMAWRYHAWIGRRGAPLRAIYRYLCNRLAARRCARYFAGRDVALVYCNTTVTPFGAMLARILRVPCLWHVREWLDNFDFGVRWALQRVGRDAAQVVTNSQAMRSMLADYLPTEQIEVVHNGPIDWPQPSPDELRDREQPRPDDLRLCMVGTVYPNKGHEDAIRLLAALNGSGIAAHLDVVGQGQQAELERLTALAIQLGVAGQITWPGFTSEPLGWMRRAHVCLVCSRREAFGRTAAEAMSVGTPVICSDVGGLREIVQDGVTGLMYKPGDVDGLADRVRALLDNPELYARLVVNGVVHVYAHFTAGIYRQRMLMLLAELAEGAGERP